MRERSNVEFISNVNFGRLEDWMRAVDINLQQSLKFCPDAGQILLGTERMVLFNQRAMLTLHELLHKNLGAALTRAFQAQFGYRCGQSDYAAVTTLYDWETEMDLLASGPVMHTWEGVVHVEPKVVEYDRQAGTFLMNGLWRNSYEAALHRELHGLSTSPVCHSLTGYATGWSSAFFGSNLIAIETTCEACGDEYCSFEIRPADEWGDKAKPWVDALAWDERTLAKELEERVEARTHDLQDAMERLRVAASQASAANEAKSAFLAATTHELRTPIAAVTGLCELMERTNLTEEQRKYLDLIRDSSEGLLNIINDVLDLSKIEANRIEIENIDFEPHALLERCLALVQSRGQSKGVEVRLEIKTDLPPRLQGDPGRIQQVALNLLSNAVKFTFEGAVTLSASAHPTDDGRTRLSLRVSDTGIGIPAERLGTLFDAFTQADSSTARMHGGTGLGLTISRRLSRLMGGDVIAFSCVGEGSVFVATFVCGTASHRRTAARTAEDTYGTDFGKAFPLRILVAEDNPVLQLLARERLEQLGYTPEIAGSGAEAVERVRDEHFELVLMDIRMPLVDGIEATRMIRQSRLQGRQPFIVAMTADAVGEQRERCRGVGMDDYLVKPAPLAELIRVLRAAHHARAGRTPQRVHGSGASEAASTWDPGSLVQLSVPPFTHNASLKVPKQSSPPPFDSAVVAAAKSELGEDFYMEMVLASFYADARKQLAVAQAQVAHGQYSSGHETRLRCAMHSLKSTSKSVGAMALAQAAERAEYCSATEVKDALQSVEAELIRIESLAVPRRVEGT